MLAIVREQGRLSPRDGIPVVVDDLSNAERTANTLKGTEILISAYAPPADDAGELVAVTRRLVSAVLLAGIGRFLMVGGAGSLEVAPGVMISMEDYAIAMVDEVERPQHPNQRFCVAY